jgi:hypothetical protein
MGLRVAALVLRYVYLYRRSLARSMEIFFWPVMDLLVWGSSRPTYSASPPPPPSRIWSGP